MPGNLKFKKAAAKQAKPAPRGKRGNDLTELGSKLPGREGKVGDKSSDRMAKDAANLVAAGEISAMSPATIIRAVADIAGASTTIGFVIARMLVQKLMVSLPGDATTTDSATQWSPSGACMYLVWALFDSLRRSGTFQSVAIINAFPPFPDDAFIPVAWAQFLSYLKPFEGPLVSAQFVDNSYSALPTAPTTSAVGVLGNSFCLGDGDFAAHPYSGVSGAEAAVSAGSGTTWANLWPLVPYLSTVWSRGMSCVRFDAIPKNAPDASAYAVRYAGPNGNYALACFTPKYNPEIAVFFTAYSNSPQASSTYAHLKPYPIQPGNAPIAFWWVETFQLCAFEAGKNLKKTLRSHVWNQANFATKSSRYKRVRVKSRRGIGKKQPVRFLIGNTISLDTRAYQALISQLVTFGGIAGLNKDNVGVFAMVCMSALIAKVTPYCYASSQTGAVPSAAFDPRYKDAELPVGLVAVLNSVGPVCVDGRLQYPTFFSINGVDMRGGWLRFSTVGNLSNVEALWSSIFSGTNAVVDVNVGSGLYIFSAANFATTTNYGSTPIVATDAILYMFNNIFGGINGGGGATGAGAGNNNLSLVKPDSHNPVGKSNMLVFADVTVPSTSNVPTFITGVTTRTIQVSGIGSFKHIAGDELGVAVCVPMVYPVDNTNAVCTVNLTGAPFRSSMTAIGRTSALVPYAQQTSTEQIGEAVAQSLALVKRKTIELGGSTVDVSQNGDIFGAIVDTIIGPIFGDAAADGIKSSPIGSIVKGFSGGPLAILDEMGVTDGIVSSFGLDNPDLAKMLPIAAAALL